MIKPHFRRRLMAVLLLTAAAPVVAAAQDQDSARSELPPAADLIGRYIEAIGGRDAITSQPDSRTIGTFSMPAMGIQGKLEVLAARHPTRLRSLVNIPGLGDIERGYTGEVGWALDPNTGPRLLEGKELAAMVDGASDAGSLRDPSMFTTRETVEKTELNGEPCYKVRLVWNSGRETFDCYSADTGLLVGTTSTEETPMGPIEVVSLLDDYKKFGDLLMATKVTQQMLGQEQVMTVDSVDYGPIDSGKFTPPQAIQTLIDQQKSGGQ